MEASIYDHELVHEVGGGAMMNPSAPAFAPSFTSDMHTCIIVKTSMPGTKTPMLRIITTTKPPPPAFTLGNFVKLGTEYRTFGTWEVYGLVNIFTMNSVGSVPDGNLVHWTLR